MSKIKVRRYTVSMPKKVEKPESPIRIVMIGDLHNRVFGDDNQMLVDQIGKEEPDLIVSVGDLTVAKHGKAVKLETGMRLLQKLTAVCPVYASLGNHEYRTKVCPQVYPGIYERMKQEMEQLQVHLLEDEKETVTVKGCTLTIYGYELPMAYYGKFCRKKISTAEISGQIGWPNQHTFQILLAHNPHYFDSYAAWGADLTFSGHAHGGIIRLPLLGGVISPQMKLFPRQVCGLYEKEGKYLCVTAGLGTHSYIPRINNPAEVTVVELR